MKARVFHGMRLTIPWLACLLAFAPAFAQEAKSPAKAVEKPAVPVEAKPAVKKADLPPAREIIDRFIKEMGGAEAYKRHKSQHATGVVQMPAQQINGTLEVYSADPNKMLVKVNLPGVGEVTTGYDGKVGYMMNPLTGPMLLDGKMLSQVAKQADYTHVLHEPQDFKSMETIDLVQFAGEECYKVKTVDKSDAESIEYYSKKTGLQRGFSTNQESPFGSMPVMSIVGEYKKFDDLLMPSVVTQKTSGMEQVMKIERMDFDKVPDDVFDLPKEIKALVKK